MTDTPSPVICVTCKRPFPAGLKQEDSPRYIGQYGLLPKACDEDNFVNEVQNLLRYIRAAAYCAHYATEMEDDISKEMSSLIQDLSEEAQRRVALASDALTEKWNRNNRRTA